MSMPPAVSRSGLFASVRSRVVAIAVVPSLIFICAVVGVGWYQSENALRVRSSATLVGDGVDATAAFAKAVVEERRASVRDADPTAARAATDAAAGEVRAVTGRLPADAQPGVRAAFGRLDDAVAAVSRARRDVDGGARDLDAYRAYAPVVDPLAGVLGVGSAPGSGNVARDVATDMGAAGDLLAVAETVRGAAAVAATAGPRGLDVPAYRALVALVGPVASALRAAVAELPAARRDAGTSLLDSTQWRTFTTNADRLLVAGPGPAPADPPRGADRVAADRAAADRATLVDELATAGDAVATRASDLAFGTAHDAAARTADAANTTLNVILGVVLGVVALAVAALLAAMRVGNRLGGRVAALQVGTQRTSTLLPGMLDRIRRGEPVDVAAELPVVDHGADEIGEVASAVDAAQRTAVAAAAEEARTRAGANAVFLNIAHRSQAIVHRQLQVLDEAERAENDSEQLGRLFQLDHLSTRERRNAENLIIMGGEEPRRRWRKPVPLAEIIRSAVSESEQYTRITLGETPDRHVDGAAVGDLIHLLAELADNATSFSPPQCPIDISASIVGRGVAVEIEDRGLGIDPEPRARLNAMLSEPPDFGLLTLSEDARLGLFVVARLADRHGVRVRLLESTYGGVQALVLVPTALLVAEPDDELLEPDGGRNGDGATDGDGFAPPTRMPANGRTTEADDTAWPRGRAAPRRSPTATAPDPVAPPRHPPSATPPWGSAAAVDLAPSRGSAAASDVAPSRGSAADAPTVIPLRAPSLAPPHEAAPPRVAAAGPRVGAAAPQVGAAGPQVEAAAPQVGAAAPQAGAAGPQTADGAQTAAARSQADGVVSTQAPTADPAAADKPALPERRPVTTSASPASPVARSAPAGPATTDAPATPEPTAPLPGAGGDVDVDAVVTAALPKVMGAPPLPERRPQGHLAKGLRGRPTTATPAAEAPAAAEPAAGRSSSAMSALQSGTRRSRKNAAPAPEATPGAEGSRG